MSQLTVTGKRQTSENPAPSSQPNKLQKTDAWKFHSCTSNQTNGHSYTPLPSLQAFSGAFSASSAHTPTPGRVNAVQERVIQSSASLNGPSAFAAFSYQPPTIPPPTKSTVIPPTQPVPTTRPNISPPTQPVPTTPTPTLNPPNQPLMTTASTPVSSPTSSHSGTADFEKGSEFQAKKDYKKAIEYYLKALEFKPDGPSILAKLGQCYRKIKEFSKAIDCYDKISQNNDMYIIGRIKIASCYIEKKEHKQAIEILREIQVPESDEHYDYLHVVFGDCYRDLQDHSQAIEHYNEVELNSSSFAWAQLFLGVCYCAKKEPQTAIGFFREAIIYTESDEIRGHAHFNLGAIYVEQEDDSKAIKHFVLVPQGHEKFDEAQEHLKQCNSN